MNTTHSLLSFLSRSPAAAPEGSSHPYRMAEPPDEEAHRGAEVVDAEGRQLPLVSARLQAKAGGGLARLVLEQTFENPYEETLRITYRMPLPADGAVSGYEFVLGARTIKGVVDRKETARERFETALLEGRTAALLDQERADIFTQQIGNVPAKATIVARITIDLRLAWLGDAGEWELRMPTVIGPRYLGAGTTEAEARAVAVTVAPSGTAARFHLELSVADAIEGDGRPTSPTHAITTTDDGLTVLRDVGGARLDRDVVVRWRVARPEVGASVVVARPAEGAHARSAYGLLTIVPPEARAAHPVPRDLIVLLDTSGSMSGPPLEQAKRVVAQIVAALGPEDTVELIEFSDSPRRFAAGPMTATEDAKKKALAWLRVLRASGATEMESAVMSALSALRAGAQRQVVLVTDGYIGGEARIVTRLHESLPASCRMHVVGVGAAVNRTLATSIARAGRGVEVLVGLDEDAERAAKRLVDRTRLPVLTDLVIEGDALVEHAPEHVPDVFAGAPVLAALKLRPEGGSLTVRGNLAKGTWQKTLHVPRTSHGDGDGSLAALYAREAVADLETRWTIGRETQEIDRQIESLGLVFQIATRKTSWVAIDETRSVDPTRRGREEVVPQELPYGTSAASFGLAGSVGMVDEEEAAFSVTRAGAVKPFAERLRSMPRPSAMAIGGGGPPTGAPPPAPRSFAAPPPPAKPAPARVAAAPPPPVAPPPAAAEAPVPGAGAGARAKKKEVADEGASGAVSHAQSAPEPLPAKMAGRPLWARALIFLPVLLVLFLFLALLAWWIFR